MVNSWQTTEENVKFPQHPFYITLPHNLFRSSSEAIRFWLEPDRFPMFGQYGGDSPIRLPSLSNKSTTTAISPTPRPLWKGSKIQSVPTKKPRFDKAERTLYLDDVPIKKFSQPALGEPPGNQEQLLLRFEDLGWPEYQDNPLRAVSDADNPLTAQERMERAVRDFNKLEEVNFLRQRKNGETPTRIFRLQYKAVRVSWFLLAVGSEDT